MILLGSCVFTSSSWYLIKTSIYSWFFVSETLKPSHLLRLSLLISNSILKKAQHPLALKLQRRGAAFKPFSALIVLPSHFLSELFPPLASKTLTPEIPDLERLPLYRQNPPSQTLTNLQRPIKKIYIYPISHFFWLLLFSEFQLANQINWYQLFTNQLIPVHSFNTYPLSKHLLYTSTLRGTGEKDQTKPFAFKRN